MWKCPGLEGKMISERACMALVPIATPTWASIAVRLVTSRGDLRRHHIHRLLHDDPVLVEGPSPGGIEPPPHLRGVGQNRGVGSIALFPSAATFSSQLLPNSYTFGTPWPPCSLVLCCRSSPLTKFQFGFF